MEAAGKFSPSINPLWTGVLDAPPSCLEFVPQNYNPGLEYFVVGTYTLLQSDTKLGEDEDLVDQDSAQGQEDQRSTKPQEKIGGLKLFKIDQDNV